MVIESPKNRDENSRSADELLPIMVSEELLMDFTNVVGYKSSDDDDIRYVAVWFEPGVDEVIVTDGYETFSGNTHEFLKWDKEAGKNRMQIEISQNDEYTDDDIPPYSINLTTLLMQSGLDIGSSESIGDCALLYDIEENDLYISRRCHVKKFINRFNNEPKWVDELPSDEDILRELFERFISDELDEQSIFDDVDKNNCEEK